MSPPPTLDELVPSSRRKRRAPYVVAGVLGGIVIVAAAVAFLPLLWTSSGSGNTLGPFSLGILFNSTSVNLSFPLCSVVTVDWNVSGVSNATLAVWGAPVPVGQYSCSGTGPYENLTCPSQGCPSGYLNDQLVCVEQGAGGKCGFQATSPNYTFSNYVPFDTDSFTGLTFIATYT